MQDYDQKHTPNTNMDSRDPIQYHLASNICKSEIAALAASQTPAIDYVLIDDTIPELEPSTAEAMQKQISARRMIYATNSFDITDLMLDRMNGKAG